MGEVEQAEAPSLYLQVGRPRMEAEPVLIFLVLRGYFHTLSSLSSIERLRDSVTILDYLQKRGLLLPGITTIVENVNAVSNETREQIHRAQLGLILSEGLDDFKELTFAVRQLEQYTKKRADETEESDLRKYFLNTFQIA